MCIIQMKSLSLTGCKILGDKAFLTYDLDPRSKVMAPNESPCMISYMRIIQMKSLSLIVCKIFAKIAFLTFDLDPRSKVMAPNESPYMISYMSTIQMKSLALTVTEILPSFEKCIPTDRQTDRPTDMVRYRAAEAAKNNMCSKEVSIFHSLQDIS